MEKKSHVVFVARVLLSVIFIFGGIGKVMDFSGTAGYIAAVGLPATSFLTVLAIIFELGGGLMLLFGWKTKIASYMLILFTAVATLMFHLDFSQQLQVTMFLKNLAIIGGLFLVSTSGPGSFSVDKR